MTPTDPRLPAFARLLVDRSIGARPGWQVLVATTTEALPVARELSRLLGERGAWCLLRVTPPWPFPADLDWAAAAPDELRDRLAPLEQELVDRVDASIFVLAPGAEEVPAPARRSLRAHHHLYRLRGRGSEIPSVRTDYPCSAYAERAGLTLAEFENIFYEACLRDWDTEGARMEPVRARLAAAEEIRVVGRGTDLRLGVTGRAWLVDDGHANVPGGEIYTSPVEDAVEGEILFDVPSTPAGGEVRDAWLRFDRGVVVDAGAAVGAEHVLAALETDEGARRAGELGVGCNEGIVRPMRNVLFDEKIAGTVHVALGAGFPQVGGRNDSALHWDLIKDLRAGGELWADGELVQRDGRWLQ